MLTDSTKHIQIISTATEKFINTVPATVMKLYNQNIGSEVLGPVQGRPITEDLQILIDQECDNLFKSIISETGLPFDIYSEHGYYRINHTSKPDYIAVIDPFDGSALFRNGIPAEWWSVFTIYDNTFKPILGKAIDILRKESYEAKENLVSMKSTSSNTTSIINPSTKTSCSTNVWIASYLMDPSYLSKWYPLTQNLLNKWPSIKIWPNGGSSIYPWISRGIIEAYLMVNEPRSEIDPGLGFAYYSGYPVYEVNSNNQLIPYEFNPELKSERTKILLASCTPELANEIIKECNIN